MGPISNESDESSDISSETPEKLLIVSGFNWFDGGLKTEEVAVPHTVQNVSFAKPVNNSNVMSKLTTVTSTPSPATSTSVPLPYASSAGQKTKVTV